MAFIELPGYANRGDAVDKTTTGEAPGNNNDSWDIELCELRAEMYRIQSVIDRHLAICPIIAGLPDGAA